MTKWSVIAVAAAIAGCTTMAPEAQNVALHKQTGTLGHGCEQLGPVSTEVSLWKMPTIDAGHAQAQNNLRADAFQQYGANAVVVETMDTHITKILAQGIAFKCTG